MRTNEIRWNLLRNSRTVHGFFYYALFEFSLQKRSLAVFMRMHVSICLTDSFNSGTIEIGLTKLGGNNTNIRVISYTIPHKSSQPRKDLVAFKGGRNPFAFYTGAFLSGRLD